MKKIVAFALAALMIMSFAACASKNKDDTSNTSSVSEKVTSVSGTEESTGTETTTDEAAEVQIQEEPVAQAEVKTDGVDNQASKTSVNKEETTTTSKVEPSSDKEREEDPTQSAPASYEKDPQKIIVSAKKEMIFTKKPTDSCHASTVLPLDDGTVVTAWFAGSSESDDDVKILTSVRSTDGVWSEPLRVSADPNVAHWNPVLFQQIDGTIILYFKVGKDTEYWKTYYSTSLDGKSWSVPRELVPGDNSGGRGPVKNKPIRLKDGTVLAPASTEIDSWKAFVDISNDDGLTWERTDYIDSSFLMFFKVPMIQPTLWQSADGSVHMFTRTKVGKIYRSDSYDGGRTWCRAYATKLPNNNSGIDLDTDENGRIFLVYNPIGIPDIRTPLTLAVSLDDGQTFTKIKTFETGLAEYSYPAVVVKGDTIHITYTYERDFIAYWQIKIK